MTQRAISLSLYTYVLCHMIFVINYYLRLSLERSHSVLERSHSVLRTPFLSGSKDVTTPVESPATLGVESKPPLGSGTAVISIAENPHVFGSTSGDGTAFASPSHVRHLANPYLLLCMSMLFFLAFHLVPTMPLNGYPR